MAVEKQTHRLNRRDRQILKQYFGDGHQETIDKFSPAELKLFLECVPRGYKKERSVAELHRIWLVASERAEKRNGERRDFVLNYIAKDIPCFNDEYILYDDDDPDRLYYYVIGWDRTLQCHTSTRRLVNSDNRVGKLDPYIADPLAYEYGKKFKYYEYMTTGLHHKIKQMMLKALWVELDKYYLPQKRAYVEEVIMVELNGYRYHVSAQNHYEYKYHYTWEGPVTDVCLNFDDNK